MAIKNMFRTLKSQVAENATFQTMDRQLDRLCHLLTNQDIAPANRAYAAIALGHSRQPDATPPLLQALRDANPSVRASAALALGYLQEPSSGPALFDALQDEDCYVRENASSSLRKMGYIECLESVPFLQSFVSPQLRAKPLTHRSLPPALAPEAPPPSSGIQLNLTGEMPDFYSWLHGFNRLVEKPAPDEPIETEQSASEKETRAEVHFVLQPLPPLLGYQRVSVQLIMPESEGGVNVIKMMSATDYPGTIYIGALSQGHFSGPYIVIEANREIEVCFRIPEQSDQLHAIGFYLADPVVNPIMAFTDKCFQSAPTAIPQQKEILSTMRAG